MLLAALGACAVPASASAVLSTTTTVDEFSDPGPGAGCSLREAVEAANTDGVFGGCDAGSDAGDEGIFLADGDYVLTRDGVDDTNSAGDLDILNESVGLNNFGGPVTIRGDLDMVGDDRVVDVQASSPGFALFALTIRDGRATGPGGGVRTLAPLGSPSYITFSTITGNQATTHGGGLEIGGNGTLFIDNTTVSGNQALGDGGGIDHAGGGTAILKNDTLTNNTADFDGGAPLSGVGGGLDTFMAGSTTTLLNTIIAGNFDATAAPTFAPDCFEYGGGPAITSQTHNLIGNTTGCEGISAGTGDIRNVNALLEPLALNRPGNPRRTQTHALQASSPARDAGDSGACLMVDQTDTARPIGPVCDIGAFEADLVPPATVVPTPVQTTPTAPTPTKRKKCKRKRKKSAATAKKRCKRKK